MVDWYKTIMSADIQHFICLISAGHYFIFLAGKFGKWDFYFDSTENAASERSYYSAPILSSLVMYLFNHSV